MNIRISNLPAGTEANRAVVKSGDSGRVSFAAQVNCSFGV